MLHPLPNTVSNLSLLLFFGAIYLSRDEQSFSPRQVPELLVVEDFSKWLFKILSYVSKSASFMPIPLSCRFTYRTSPLESSWILTLPPSGQYLIALCSIVEIII